MMAGGSFSAQVQAWAEETKERMKAVRDGSAQRVVEVMQEPGPSVARTRSAISKGSGLGKNGRASRKQFGPVGRPGGAGKIPVDLGFLRASLVALKGNGNLPPVTQPGAGPRTYNGGAVNLMIAGARLDEALTFVYTAAYARRVHDGFSGQDRLGRTYNQRGALWVTLAAQLWVRIVGEEAAKAKAGATS